MSDKKMAYVVEIKDLEPIEGKDRIVLASFTNSGWRVIVQKDQFQIGDKAIYVETDSILPMWEEFQFLEKRCYSTKRKGYRIRTMKLGDVYSEGICFDLKGFYGPPGSKIGVPIDAPLDRDLTEILKIRRIEDEVPQDPPPTKSKFQNFVNKWLYRLFRFKFKRYGFIAQDFPSYLIKTDETQAQSIPQLFEKMKGRDVYITLKMDGQSVTMANYKGVFSISTRNRMIYQNKIKKAARVLIPKSADYFRQHNVHAYLAAKYNIPLILSKYDNVAIQGECCGPGIQKNRIGLKDYEYYIFSFFDISKREYFSGQKMMNFCLENKLITVPFIEMKTFNWDSIKELEEYAQRDYASGTPAEGIVIRGYEHYNEYMPQPHNKMHAMCSLKMINPKFKLKYQQDE